MEIIEFRNFSFTYPCESAAALKNINLKIESGAFVTVCGESGCGKTTLLRNIKSVLAPHGTQTGIILFGGKNAAELSEKEQCLKIGYVLQDPDNQIVTDKVWHELAFGLENMGVPNNEIRGRVAETASFFGIHNWFHKNTNELSGGQKQLLNLASVMVMQPEVLILDEPTSRLDPIAADEFLQTLSKINKELGTTVILSEHRLEGAFPRSDKIVVMENGSIISDTDARHTGDVLKKLGSGMFAALPAAVRVFESLPWEGEIPVTVSEGRAGLIEFARRNEIKNIQPEEKKRTEKEEAIKLKDVWFKYAPDEEYIIKGLSMTAYKGEVYALLGGNGAGKTTALSIIGKILKPQRGSAKTICDVSGGKIGILPQNPQTLFVKKTVELDLYEMLSDSDLPKEEQRREVEAVMGLCELSHLKDRHPYDLSGGEQQRAALAKVLLMKPEILLLDEPTKGMDASFKKCFARILDALKNSAAAIIMVSHDIEFCAQYADRCGLMFDGNVISEDAPRKFFSGKSFYTTAASRMAHGIIDNAVLAEDIIAACGGEVAVTENRCVKEYIPVRHEGKEENEKERLSAKRLIPAAVFILLAVLTAVLVRDTLTGTYECIAQGAELLLLGFGITLLLPNPGKVIGADSEPHDRKLTKRTVAAFLLSAFAVPLTIFIGVYYMGDRKYYFISLLIILETLAPFFLIMEKRRARTRELIILSVLSAIAVAGRAAFYMLPEFKPTATVVIISGIAFGGEAGFLVGAISAFVSNFFFGQGPWTPWQMFAFGMAGLFAGILFQKGFIAKRKISMCIFSAVFVLVFCGVILNCGSVIMYQANPNLKMFVSSCIMGLPFDLIHALSTAFFMWFIGEPLLEKLDRIKEKYEIRF